MAGNDDNGAKHVTDHERDHAMNGHTVLLSLLLSGFFAVACIRASVPKLEHQKAGAAALDLLRLPGRIERLQRSRWQWFAMVALMIVLRLQQQLPVVLELMAALQFLLFLAIPARSSTARRERQGALSR